MVICRYMLFKYQHLSNQKILNEFIKYSSNTSMNLIITQPFSQFVESLIQSPLKYYSPPKTKNETGFVK